MNSPIFQSKNTWKSLFSTFRPTVIFNSRILFILKTISSFNRMFSMKIIKVKNQFPKLTCALGKTVSPPFTISDKYINTVAIRCPPITWFCLSWKKSKWGSYFSPCWYLRTCIASPFSKPINPKGCPIKRCYKETVIYVWE